MAKPKYVATGGGIACTQCGQPAEIRKHAKVTEKILSQPYYFSQWFYCTNGACPTTTIMRDEYRVYPGQPPPDDAFALCAETARQYAAGEYDSALRLLRLAAEAINSKLEAK